MTHFPHPFSAKIIGLIFQPLYLRDIDYLRRFFHSSHDAPDQWNYTGYNSAQFNRLAVLQTTTLNLEKRRRIVFQLQKLLSMDLPCIPLYIPHRMEGIRTDRFAGWVKQVGGVGNIWTFCMLKPIRRQPKEGM